MVDHKCSFCNINLAVRLATSSYSSTKDYELICSNLNCLLYKKYAICIYDNEIFNYNLYIIDNNILYTIYAEITSIFENTGYTILHCVAQFQGTDKTLEINKFFPLDLTQPLETQTKDLLKKLLNYRAFI